MVLIFIYESMHQPSCYLCHQQDTLVISTAERLTIRRHHNTLPTAASLNVSGCTWLEPAVAHYWIHDESGHDWRREPVATDDW